MDIQDAYGPDNNSLANARANTPGTPPPPSNPTPEVNSKTDPKLKVEYTAVAIASVVFSILFFIVFSYGAAKLSYDKYRSVGWAVLDFFFSSFYYPYYAIVLNNPTVMGGRR